MGAYMGDRGAAYRVLIGKPDGKRPLERPGGRTILKWIFKTRDELTRSGLICFRIGTGGLFL
jgi:hypothetical protein